jgi:hypothetical protein
MLTIALVLVVWIALYFLIFAISQRFTCAPIRLFMFGSALCFWSVIGLLSCLYLRCVTSHRKEKKGV